MVSAKNALKNNYCHDCGDAVKSGYTLFYKNSEGKIKIYKCGPCYKKDPSLKNFQKCEVYSRIVGYIRPVQQWHKGKQQEFGERLEFKYAVN